MACLTITRVSNSSVSILPRRPRRTSGLTKIMPFGATALHISTTRALKHKEDMQRTGKVVLDGTQQSRRILKVRDAEFVLAFEILDATQTRRITVVVCDHDGGIQRLKVEYNDRPFIECRVGFHDQGHTFGSILFADLRRTIDLRACIWQVKRTHVGFIGGYQDEAFRLGYSKHK